MGARPAVRVSFFTAVRSLLLATISAFTIGVMPQRPKGRSDTLSSLNAATDALNLASKTTSMNQAKDAFGSTRTLLATIGVGFAPTVSAYS